MSNMGVTVVLWNCPIFAPTLGIGAQIRAMQNLSAQ